MWVCVRSVDRPQLSAPAEAPLHQVCESVSLADEEPGPAPLLSPGTAMVLSGHHCARGPIIHSSLWPGSSYSGVCLPPLCCYFILLSAYCVLVTCSRAGACEKHEEQGGLCTHTRKHSCWLRAGVGARSGRPQDSALEGPVLRSHILTSSSLPTFTALSPSPAPGSLVASTCLSLLAHVSTESERLSGSPVKSRRKLVPSPHTLPRQTPLGRGQGSHSWAAHILTSQPQMQLACQGAVTACHGVVCTWLTTLPCWWAVSHCCQGQARK